MTAIGTTPGATLADIASRLDANGKIPAIVEILNTTNEILEDMIFVEGNLPTGHKSTVRTGLPTAYWRRLNAGVPNSKSTTVAVTDACGMLEAYAEVDKALADLNGNTAAWRLSEDVAFIEAINQQMATAMFYADQLSNPERFDGVATRYDDSTAASWDNVISGAGSGQDNTSVWLISWGEDATHGIFPKGSQAGLSHKDLGEVTLFDSNNYKYQGYRSHYKWDIGLTVRDWRQNVRIANIDVSDLTKTGTTGADLVDLMVQAVERLPVKKTGRLAWYCNRTVRAFLRRQMMNKSNVWLSLDQVGTGGRKVLNFDGIPVRRCDAITNTETAVS